MQAFNSIHNTLWQPLSFLPQPWTTPTSSSSSDTFFFVRHYVLPCFLLCKMEIIIGLCKGLNRKNKVFSTKYMLWIHVNLYYKLNQESLFHPQSPGSTCKGHGHGTGHDSPPNWGALRLWPVQPDVMGKALLRFRARSPSLNLISANPCSCDLDFINPHPDLSFVITKVRIAASSWQ